MRLRSLLILLALAAFSSCNRASGPREGVFRTLVRDDAKSLDPASAYDSVSLTFVPEIYEPLLQYAPTDEGYRLEPLLADGMPTLSRDGLTLSVRIKSGVRFQDDPCFKATGGKGREVTAQDFVYSLKRLALPSLRSEGWWILDRHVAGINAFHDRLLQASGREERAKLFAAEVEGLRATGDHAFEIRFVRRYPAFKYILAMTFVAPVPHEAVEAYGDEQGNLTDHPVGTGPFRLKSWERNRRIVLERNPDYRPAPEIREATFDIVHEAQPGWLGFLRGNYDVISVPKDNLESALPTPRTLSKELRDKGIRLVLPPPARLYYLTFNMKDPLLGRSKLLRQAISSLIDRDKWVATFTNGLGIKAVNATPPEVADRPRTDRIKYDYDVARAKKLLAEAGYPEGKGLPPISLDLRGADSVSRQTGEFLTQLFAAGGLRLNVIYNTFPAYLKKVKEGRHQLAAASWGLDYPDAENMYQLLYGSVDSADNISGFDDAEMNRLYERMSVMEPGPERAALIQRMDDILQEECPWVLTYFLGDPRITQPWLEGYVGNPYLANPMKYYRIRLTPRY